MTRAAFAALAFLGLTACGASNRLKYFGKAPDFELISQTGQQISLANLRGKVWVADTFFTTCAGPCPLMSSKLQKLEAAVGSLPNVRVVSFTVDPEHDTQQAMLEYSGHFHAAPDRWFFLTGPQAALNHATMEGLHLSKVDGSLDHSTAFVLVDADTNIRGYYRPFEQGQFEQLISDVLWLTGSTTATTLTAEQYTRAEDLYWKVMARCCIRKPGAAKIHQQIEKQVAEGKSDEAILADFAARYGGGPVNLDRVARQPASANRMLLAPLGLALVAGAVVCIRRRTR